MKKLLLPILLLTTIILSAQVDAPINSAFVDYMSQKYSGTWKMKTSDGYALGEIPELVIPHFSSYEPVSNNLGSKSFPSSYDIRSSYVTSVKNQNPYGTCWAHAGCGAIESNWLKTGYGTYDLSESNTATCHGFEWGWNDGGNRSLAGGYFSRLGGPISEADDSYSRLALNDTLCHTGLTPVAFQTNVRFLPNNMDSIKQALMDHGAIYTNYYHDNAYMGPNDTYYCNQDLGTNHAVLIVGWDDNMDTDATQNGAWIIKNSWGSYWGDNGYFYISYYDLTINTAPAYFITREDYNSQATLYNYAEIGAISNTGYGSEIAYGLNKFVATSDQTITKVGTYVNTDLAVLDFEIYDTFSGGTLSGLLGTLTGQQCDYPGYYMFDLSSGINISNGDDFYVKVKYNTPGYNYPIPFEMYYGGYADPTIEAGVCWISSSGSSWSAWGNNVSGKERDLTIRAYTVPQVVSTYDVTFNVSDGTNPLENAEVVFNSQTQYTNASGQTIFTGLSNGTYPYTVSKTGYQSDNDNVTVSGGNVTHNVTLTENTYNVTFAVTDGTNPIENAEVTFNSTTQYTNVSGLTIFSGISVGNGQAYSVTKAGYNDVNSTVDVVDQDVNENVTMTALTYNVTFNVTDGTNPLENAEVTFNSTTQYTNVSGQTIFSGVSVGNGQAYSVTKTGYNNANSTVDVVDQDVSENVTLGWSGSTTKLKDEYCGSSSTNSNYTIYCDGIWTAEDYEFRFINSGASFDQSITTSSVWGINYGYRNYLKLYNIPNIKYGLTYDVQIRYKENGVWGPYGTVCQFTLEGTKLKDGYCGIAVSNLNTNIYAQGIYSATDYEFKFVNASAGFNETKTTSSVWGASLGSRNYMKLYFIPNIQYGYTYDVQVRAKVNNEWTEWGEVCQYTINGTKLKDEYCGVTISQSNTWIYADGIYNATNYEFRFTNTATLDENTKTTASVWGASLGYRNYLRLYLIPGLTWGSTYNVDCRAYYNGSWTPYGQVCQLTYGPGTKILLASKSEISMIKPELYPNPFTDFTNLIITGDYGQLFNVYISDVTGKIIEKHVMQSNQVYEIGQTIDNGIYMIIVLGNNNEYKETIKFIKN